MRELFREALRHYKTRRADHSQDDLQWVMRLIKEAKQNPLTSAELAAETKRLTAYGSSQAKKLGIKESDVVRRIHESRNAKA